MKLLIVTQAVDRNDPVLGFFHSWISAFAGRSESVAVICLRKGEYELPPNVSVHSLGKEAGISRLKYLVRLYRYTWTLRGEYDAVFVHMNQEYVLLAGILWRLMGKRVVLWRNHKKGSILTRIAAFISHSTCYTSRDAYVAGYTNAVRMPIGIDTDLFRPSVPEPNSILFIGRLDPVKRGEILIKVLQELHAEGVRFHADIVGSPTEGNEQYANDLRSRAEALIRSGVLTMRPGVPHSQTPMLYASHIVCVNLTPSGSFDKTIGEAMASGCIVVATNNALSGVISPDLFVKDSAQDLKRALSNVLSMTEHDKQRERDALRSYIVKEHNLQLLVTRLIPLFK